MPVLDNASQRLRVVVGSTRPAKVEAVREALALIAKVDHRFRHADVIAVEVGDAAPRMPMTDAAVRAGAHARVMALLSSGHDNGSICLGLEGGLDPVDLPQRGLAHAIRTWACASDGQRFTYGAGPSVILPDPVAAEVLAGAELGDVVDRRAGAAVRGTRGAWGLLTGDLIGRRDAFRLAVVAALAPFYNPAPFAE